MRSGTIECVENVSCQFLSLRQFLELELFSADLRQRTNGCDAGVARSGSVFGHGVS